MAQPTLLRKLSDGDAKYQTMIKAAEDGHFAVAFRKACHSGTLSIIKTIFKFQKVLGFNLQERSSNGKAACDWLEENTTISPQEKTALLFYLQNCSPTESSFLLK